MGCAVRVESGAGIDLSISDEQYRQAGAEIMGNITETLSHADIILKVQAPDDDELKVMKKGALLIGILAPYKNETLLEKMRCCGD